MTPKEVVHAVYPELKGPPRAADPLPLARSRSRGLSGGAKGGRRDVAMGISGLVAGMQVNFAGCCHPLPGDRILGIVTTGKGVTVHKADCHNLSGFADSPERFLDIDWDYEEGAGGAHLGRIEVVASADRGSLSAVTDAIARQDGAIENLRIHHRGPDFQEISIDVEVKDLRHLSNIIAALRAVQGVAQAERAKG